MLELYFLMKDALTTLLPTYKRFKTSRSIWVTISKKHEQRDIRWRHFQILKLQTGDKRLYLNLRRIKLELQQM